MIINILDYSSLPEPWAEEEETRIPLYRGLIPIVLIGFSAAAGAIYCAIQAGRALLG
ncbi:hypothetical protein [Mesorhizobium sp. WSM4303]|uniref:hypothetical protein n=1 Tax=Mesorhizobium sp. WSM4303 TaxID=2589887 RepID=UPI00163DAB04|nr:hypothetical protein [Mesorhizobium sp. WSM4303]